MGSAILRQAGLGCVWKGADKRAAFLQGLCSSFLPWVSASASLGDGLKPLRWKNSFLPTWLHGVDHSSSWITWHGRNPDSYKVERERLTPKGSLLTSTQVPWHTCACNYTQGQAHTHQTRKEKEFKRRKARKEKWWTASWQMTNVSNLQGEGSERLSMNSTALLSQAQCLGGTLLNYPNCSHQAWPCQWLLRHRVLLWL